MVDVSQDVIINTEDCGTLRGIEVQSLKKNEEIVESLGERILGRVSLHDVYNPLTEELLLSAGQEISEADVKRIEASPVEKIEVRSPLTCEADKGICGKCYGRNLSASQVNGERTSIFSTGEASIRFTSASEIS